MSLSIQFNKRMQSRQMNVIDHLEALRGHIVRSLLAIVLMGILIFIYRDWVFDHIITGPIHADFITYTAMCRFGHWAHMGNALCMPPVKVDMQSTTFGGQFMSTISMSFIGGFMIAFPYIFWEFWRFVKPALKEKELKGTKNVIGWVSFFFLTGAAFGYLLLAPFTFNFLSGFQLGIKGILVTRPTLTDYLDNLSNIMLGCGLAFELPVLAYVLTRIGLINPTYLRKIRKYAIVVLLIVAAVITPSPDWMSQMIVFTPLCILYELSIAVAANALKKSQEAGD